MAYHPVEGKPLEGAPLRLVVGKVACRHQEEAGKQHQLLQVGKVEAGKEVPRRQGKLNLAHLGRGMAAEMEGRWHHLGRQGTEVGTEERLVHRGRHRGSLGVACLGSLRREEGRGWSRIRRVDFVAAWGWRGLGLRRRRSW